MEKPPEGLADGKGMMLLHSGLPQGKGNCKLRAWAAFSGTAGQCSLPDGREEGGAGPTPTGSILGLCEAFAMGDVEAVFRLNAVNNIH